MKLNRKNAQCALYMLLIACMATSSWAHRRWTSFPQYHGLRVLTTVPQTADIAKKIGHKKVSTLSLLKSGQDFHEPKIYKSMVRATGEADALLRLNPGLDPWIDDLIKKSKNKRLQEQNSSHSCLDVTTLQLSQSLDSLFRDRRIAEDIARKVFAAIVQADPKNESYYRTNLDAYLQDMENQKAKQ